MCVLRTLGWVQKGCEMSQQGLGHLERERVRGSGALSRLSPRFHAQPFLISPSLRSGVPNPPGFPAAEELLWTNDLGTGWEDMSNRARMESWLGVGEGHPVTNLCSSRSMNQRAVLGNALPTCSLLDPSVVAWLPGSECVLGTSCGLV